MNQFDMGNKTIAPLTPDEVGGKKISTINPNMIEAVNNMITKNWNGSYSTFKQCELIDEYFKISKINKTKNRVSKLFDDNQLDFEPVFEEAGWDVTYDKPAYNETYEPIFEFKRKK